MSRYVTRAGRPWPLRQRSAVQAIRSAIHGWRAHPVDADRLDAFPDKAVVVNVHRSQQVQLIHDLLVERLPYRDCAIEVRERNSDVLGDMVVVYPLPDNESKENTDVGRTSGSGSSGDPLTDTYYDVDPKDVEAALADDDTTE